MALHDDEVSGTEGEDMQVIVFPKVVALASHGFAYLGCGIPKYHTHKVTL